MVDDVRCCFDIEEFTEPVGVDGDDRDEDKNW
jgi:hypothetical protein